MSSSLGEGLFKLTHQIVSLKVDVRRRLLEGFTEMILMPSIEKANVIRCHSRQSQIHKVFVNGIECSYQLEDPLGELVQSNAPKAPEYAEEKYAEALLAANKGELVITLPDAVNTFSLVQKSDSSYEKPSVEEADRVDMNEDSEAEGDRQEQLCVTPQKEESRRFEYQPIRLRIEYGLANPASGVYFVLPEDQLCPNRPAYMYVWSSYNHARVWVPCFDFWQETTSWELEFTVNSDHVVICNGELQKEKSAGQEIGMLKRVTYRMDVPCSASQLSFAVGSFEAVQEASTESVTYYAPQGNSTALAHSTEFMKKLFEFSDHYFDSPFPYESLNIVFLEHLTSETISRPGVIFLSLSLLHTRRMIDQLFETRRLLVLAYCRQWFTNYVMPLSWTDLWLTIGCSFYVALQFFRIHFGQNDHNYCLKQSIESVCNQSGNQLPLCDAHYLIPEEKDTEFTRTKAGIILHMIGQRLGHENLQKVLNKLLTNVLEGDIANGISTHAFLKFIRKVTKKDIRYWVNQWIFQSGYPKIECSYSFNRKKCIIELRVTQEVPYRYFVGPLLVRVQEPEGSFEHTLNLDSLEQVFEFPYHSKGKRRKPKRTKAIDDLSSLSLGSHHDATIESSEIDSHLSWILVDPNTEWIADIAVRQTDQMHSRMTLRDKCVVAQCLAIDSLKTMPGSLPITTFHLILSDSKIFYKVRMKAAQALASRGDPDESTDGLSRLLHFFQKSYAIDASEVNYPFMVRPNNFADVSEYFVLKSVVTALGDIRTGSSEAPASCVKLLLNIIRYNDNSINEFSDEVFLATVIRALATCFTPNPLFSQKREELSAYSISRSHLEETLSEILRYLRRENLVFSPQKTLTEACLYGLRMIYLNRIAPFDLKVFLKYSLYNQPRRTRQGAFESLISLALGNIDIVRYFIETIKSDIDPWARLMVSRSLWTFLPRFDRNFRALEAISDSGKDGIMIVFSELWNMLNQEFRFDQELRLSIIDLYSLARNYLSTKNILEEPDKRKPNLPRLRIVLPSSGQRTIQKNQKGSVITTSNDAFPFSPSKDPAVSSPIATAATLIKDPNSFSYTEAYRRCKTILSRLKSQNESWPFLDPVDPVALNVPMYFDVVEHPMDLGTIEKRLSKKTYYDSIDAFEKDVRLVFSNCFLFNPRGDLVYDLGKKMESVFNQLLQREKEMERLTKIQSFQKFKQSESFSLARDLLSKFLSSCMTNELSTELAGFIEKIHHLSMRLKSGEFCSFEEFQRSLELYIILQLDHVQNDSKAGICLQELANQLRNLISDSTIKIRIPIQEALVAEDLAAKKKISPVLMTNNLSLGGLKIEDKYHCQKCLKKLWKHNDSPLFRAPVDAKALGASHYYEVIKNPIDLGTISKKLNADQTYNTVDEFEDDLRLMFTNCYSFNSPDSEVFSMAKRLEAYFDKIIKIRTMIVSSNGVANTPEEFQDNNMKLGGMKAATTEIICPIDSAGFPLMTSRADGDDKKRRQSNKSTAQASRGSKVWKAILKKLKSHRSAWPFLVPVDAVALGVPQYYEVIKVPMDLSTIQKRLQQNDFYKLDSEFERDVRLIFENCLSFNAPDAVVHVEALRLEQYFNRLWRKSSELSRRSKKRSEAKKPKVDLCSQSASPSATSLENITKETAPPIKIKLKLSSLN